MCKGKKSKMVIGILLVFSLIAATLIVPLQSALAGGSDDAQIVTRGAYYDLPETVENYVSSGKTLEFDLNMQVAGNDVFKIALCNDKTRTGTVTSAFNLYSEGNKPEITVDALSDGWYHYTISLQSVAPSNAENIRPLIYLFISGLNIQSVKDKEIKIKNISIGIDVRSLPEAFTDGYDTVTLADLGLAGTDYKTPVFSDTYQYNGKSETKSVVVKFGWDANVTDGKDWKIALDTFWNANCMAWFLPGLIYFCPGQGSFHGLTVQADPVTTGRHDVEFGRLRVVAGPNYGKDFVFIKIDGEVRASQYTDYYQTEGGYAAYNDTIVSPSYTVCFVGDGVSSQRFSGFAKPDEYVADIDYVNLGDIVPGGVVKNTVLEDWMNHTYSFNGLSKTHSTVVKYVVKTGEFDGTYDESVMTVDIGGNCGYCRSYISPGEKSNILFGWEIEGCKTENWIKPYPFKSNSWYAVEQGRLRVISGIHKGKDYVYLKIDGDIVSSFYGEPDSKPFAGNQIYVEATNSIQVTGYNELAVKYYVDDELYLNGLAQKGLNVKQPTNPKKDGQYFIGWYTEKTGGKLFDFKNTKLIDNINLYARFTTETVTATFDAKNGQTVSNVTVGKGCLVLQPATPSYSDGKYEYTFVGWKNEATGKIFNFETDRISANTTFTAQYKEKEYYVSYYANGSLVKKVPFVLSNPTVAGKEPSVPAVPNTTGSWESHITSGLTKSITVNAVYKAKAASASTAIKLNGYSGGKIYLNTDTVHAYLSTESAAQQTAFVREHCAAFGSYQDYQNTTFKWTDSGKNSKYTVYFADNKEFKNPYIVTTDKTSLINEAGIFTPGKTYYWFVCGNNTGKCSVVDSFTVVNTPVRYITAGKVTNMRDEGGYMTGDGSKVKYGLVYRGASLDEYHSHIDDEARKVFNYLGMNSEIELRAGCNHEYTPWDENNPNVYYVESLSYENMLNLSESVRAQFKETFEAMADKNNYPFYFHCSAGADRTGAFGYLLNGLLGVPYEDLRKDYELTSFSDAGLRPADTFADGSMDNLTRLLIEQYGDGSENLQVAIQNYFIKYFGVGESTIEAIKNIMLDKNPTLNDKPYKITVDVLGKKYTYEAFGGIYFMPEAPQVFGKIFVGFYNGNTKYNGYAKSNLNLVAKFENIQYEPYDTISLKDLGVKEDKILSQTNTVYTYNKTAKSGGRLFRFILEPIGSMDNGNGPQLALTGDFTKNSAARVWFQNNAMSHIYYSGVMDSLPDVSKTLSLEAGKQYDIQFAVRIMKNKGYEGKKVFEVTVNGELLIQYIGCKSDLSENMIFFHGGTGAAYLINKPVYKTVKFYNGSTLIGTYQVERCGLIPKVTEPSKKNGLPFAGWYTAKSGGTLWDENADLVYDNMSLYAHFANVKVIKANVEGKILTYRVEVGKTLDTIPKPQKPGHVFAGWTVNGKQFTGKVTQNMNVIALFEAYSFDDYDEISLRDLGIYRDLDFASFGDLHIKDYTYRKAAKTGGRVFKAIYIPTENMINGPQVSFSQIWTENYFAKLYFTKYDEFYIYSSGIVDGLPTFKKQYNFIGGKEYRFEFGVRVLNNKGYKGVKVLTLYINGELIYEEFDNRANLDGETVFFQGMADVGIFRGVDIYKTVYFYDEDKLLSSVKVLRGKTVKSIGKLSNKGDKLFMGWFTEYGVEWNFDADGVYLDTVLKAKYQKRTYPVRLMVDDVLYKRINVFAGECADISDTPVKDGYEFDKWLNEDGSVYDITTPVTFPVTLLASFTKQSEEIIPQKEKDVLNGNRETKQSYFIYVLFGILGLAVIGAETGIIVYKKRSNR